MQLNCAWHERVYDLVLLSAQGGLQHTLFLEMDVLKGPRTMLLIMKQLR